jgi:tetrahydromethanopterin S-methyltransferase subunit B
MALIQINIENYCEPDNSITLKLDQIMATIQELSAKVDALQAALDQEQQEILDAIDALEQTIEDLQALVVDGGTEAERQAVSDKLDAVIADLQATVNPGSTTTTSTTTVI